MIEDQKIIEMKQLQTEDDHRNSSSDHHYPKHHHNYDNSSITKMPSIFKTSSSSIMMSTTIIFIIFMTTCTIRLTDAASITSSSDPSSSSHASSQTMINPIVASFSTSNSSVNFTHVTFDPISGRVYLGVINWIYQLNSSLGMEHSVQTGPVDDSVSCSPTDCLGVDDHMIKSTKNVNKVLVIDPSSRMLISCGSIHQGSCRRHSLSDVRNVEPLIGIPVAANDENSSTVAFVGTAHYGTSISNVLYVATSNSKLGPYRDVVPAISTRSLEHQASGSKLFSIIEKSFTDTARVDISYHVRDYFIVKYIYGFQSNDFVYFSTVQKKSHFRQHEEWGYHTRLSRVCSSDAGYHTYTEVTLECSGPDGLDYNLLQDASVMRVGSSLAQTLRIEEGSEVLIGTFSVSVDHTSSPSAYSAVCIYPMDQIETVFSANIHSCYNGSTAIRNMDYIAGNIQDCPKAGKSGNVMNFCGENLKINGSIPITGYSVINYHDVTVTSVLPLNTGRQTSIFLGTSNGHLKKIDLDRRGSVELYDIPVDEGHPILPDMFVDRSKKNIYLSSPYKVVKVLVDEMSSSPDHTSSAHHEISSTSYNPNDMTVVPSQHINTSSGHVVSPAQHLQEENNSVYNMPDVMVDLDLEVSSGDSSQVLSSSTSSPPYVPRVIVSNPNYKPVPQFKYTTSTTPKSSMNSDTLPSIFEPRDTNIRQQVFSSGSSPSVPPVNNNNNSNSHEPDVASVIICAMSIAVVGTIAILAVVTFYKRNRLSSVLRKQYSHGSTSSSSSSTSFQKHDPSKVPPPLIGSSSSCSSSSTSNGSMMKQLPLIPLHHNHSVMMSSASPYLTSSIADHHQHNNQSSSQVYAIYSEIDDHSSGSTSANTPDNNCHPLLNMTQVNTTGGNNNSFNLLNHFNVSNGGYNNGHHGTPVHHHHNQQPHVTQQNNVTRVVMPGGSAYPPFITYNTVGTNGRNRVFPSSAGGSGVSSSVTKTLFNNKNNMTSSPASSSSFYHRDPWSP